MVNPVLQVMFFSDYPVLELLLMKAGETVNVRFELPIQELALYNIDLKKVVEPGEFELQVGSASDQIKFKKSIYVIGSNL